MSLLQKIGQVLLKGTELIPGVGAYAQVIAGAIGGDQASAAVSAGVVKVDSTIEEIIQAVQIAEAMGTAISAPGAQKATMAAPIVSQIMLRLAHAKGWKIANETKFNADCTALGGVVADIMNDISGDSVQAQNVS